MKKFENPKMNVVRLEPEDVMRTSSCFETFECKECYCSAVTCDSSYSCTGLVCPGLD